MEGSGSGSRASIEALVLAAFTVVLFAAAGYVPILGVLVSLLAPTPLVLVALRHGLRMGCLALGLAGLCLALFFGIFQSLIFVAEYGVMAVVMAGAIRLRWSVEKTLGAATLAPFLVSGLVMLSLLPTADLDLGAIRKHFEDNLSQALQPYLMEGDRATAEEVRAYVQEAMGHVIRLLPALFVISTAVGAILNYGVVRLLWRRLQGPPWFPDLSFVQWTAPETCVWVLIASGVASFLPIPLLQSVGLNALLLCGLVYLAQGLAILFFYLNKASVAPIFRWIAYLLLVIQPLLLLGVAAFGLFDLWFDFRRLRNKREDAR
ncbi:MAG TPA: DUF2232 domain-containing protein [Alphaproteobacteria bacterium]|nr:DUF2232 domain-containing protein [Alphaproteobacteria bacterium]